MANKRFHKEVWLTAQAYPEENCIRMGTAWLNSNGGVSFQIGTPYMSLLEAKEMVRDLQKAIHVLEALPSSSKDEA